MPQIGHAICPNHHKYDSLDKRQKNQNTPLSLYTSPTVLLSWTIRCKAMSTPYPSIQERVSRFFIANPTTFGIITINTRVNTDRRKKNDPTNPILVNTIDYYARY